jgi:hypothetical protein
MFCYVLNVVLFLLGDSDARKSPPPQNTKFIYMVNKCNVYLKTGQKLNVFVKRAFQRKYM